MTTTLPKLNSPISQPSTQTRESLVNSHIEVAKRLAGQTYRKLGGSADYEDLLGYAYEGLLVAADRYQPGQNASFLTFAYKRIVGCMYDGIGKSARFTRGIARNRSESECNDLYAKAHWPTEKQVNQSEQRVMDKQVQRIIKQAIQNLPPRKRQLIEERYFEDQNLEHSANRQGKSVSWASRLHASALKDLRKELLSIDPSLECLAG